MKIAAVICELNPFHNGHALLFRKLREEYGADYIIAIMSGNYVQRGEPAVCDKYVRTEMALIGDDPRLMEGTDRLPALSPDKAMPKGGYADLVIELPPVFACSSAHDFAEAGVRLAISTGIVDILGFGMEAPATLEQLKEYAGKIDQAESQDNGSLKELLESGMSYPAALSRLLCANALTPNNILAVEYLRALNRINKTDIRDDKMIFSSAGRIMPAGIFRQGDRYHDTDIHDASFASASALRKRLLLFRDNPRTESTAACKREPGCKGKPVFPFSSVPKPLHPLYCRLLDSALFVSPDDLSVLLSERLLKAAFSDTEGMTRESPEHPRLSSFLDVSDEIGGRLINRALQPMTFLSRIEDTKTRQYTYSRISRALLHIALCITKEETARLKADGYARYIRILGFRRDAAPLLHELKARAILPVISKPADHKELLGRDLYFDQIYYSLQAQIRKVHPDGAEIRSELMRSPVVI